MARYRYLIVGGGMAADAAIHGIREIDPDGGIGLLGAEPDLPYNRPPLTKGLWLGKPVTSIWRNTDVPHLDVHLGHRVHGLDPAKREVIDADGHRIGYDKLLLATGGTPRRLPFGGEEIIYYRTLADYRRLRELADHGERIAVIGAGFIGSEIAAALAQNGKDVVMAFPGTSIGGHLFPAELGMFLNGYYREHGIQLLPGERAAALERRGEHLILTTHDRLTGTIRETQVDAVVAGIGIEPATELATIAGLRVENGVVVDSALRTSDPDIFAAGDVASCYVPALDRRMRVEHEDNALTMGRMAGRSMAGEAVDYEHLSYFYSDLFDLGYEAVGELDARHETVAEWETPHRKGVIYYLEKGRVRGVLLWNVWGQVDAARALIRSEESVTAESVKGSITF